LIVSATVTGVALSYCIALIQFLVGERKLGRRKTAAAVTAIPAH